MESSEDIGDDAHNQKQYHKAIEYYSIAIKSKPNDLTLFSKRAASYFNIQDYENAEADANFCIFFKGDWSKGYQLKAMVQIVKGDLHSAHKNIQIAVAQDAKNTQTIKQPSQIDYKITSDVGRKMKENSGMNKKIDFHHRENMQDLVFEYISSRESQNQIENIFQKAKTQFDIELNDLKNQNPDLAKYLTQNPIDETILMFKQQFHRSIRDLKDKNRKCVNSEKTDTMQNSGDKDFTTEVKKNQVNFQSSLDQNHVNSRGLKMNNLLNDNFSFKSDGLCRVGEVMAPYIFIKPKTLQKISFNPTQAIALIIGNVNYDGEKYEKLADVEQNINNVSEVIKFLGIKKVNYLKDFTKEELEKMVKYLKQEFLLSRNSETKKTFLFVYYAGHGLIQNGMSAIVLKSNDTYQLEAVLRKMAASNKNTFTMAVFDTCRQNLESDQQSQEKIRLKPDEQLEGNIKLIFCCKPTSYVPEVSNFSIELKREVIRHVEHNGFFKDLKIHRLRAGNVDIEEMDRTNVSLCLQVPGYPKINWRSYRWTENQNLQIMTPSQRKAVLYDRKITESHSDPTDSIVAKNLYLVTSPQENELFWKNVEAGAASLAEEFKIENRQFNLQKQEAAYVVQNCTKIENRKLFTIFYAPIAIQNGMNNFEFIFGDKDESKEDAILKYFRKKDKYSSDFQEITERQQITKLVCDKNHISAVQIYENKYSELKGLRVFYNEELSFKIGNCLETEGILQKNIQIPAGEQIIGQKAYISSNQKLYYFELMIAKLYNKDFRN